MRKIINSTYISLDGVVELVRYYLRELNSEGAVERTRPQSNAKDQTYRLR